MFDNLEKCKMFWLSPQLKMEVLIINFAHKVVLLFGPEDSVLRKLRETNACYGMKSAKTSIFQQHGNYFVYTDATYIFKTNNNIIAVHSRKNILNMHRIYMKLGGSSDRVRFALGK